VVRNVIFYLHSADKRRIPVQKNPRVAGTYYYIGCCHIWLQLL
jgi:hypothetical protein